jgi:hypothetical protein
MGISYQSRPVWDYNRDQISCDAALGTRSFRCHVTVDFLTGGEFRPLREDEAMRLFETHRAAIERQWERAARAAGRSDDEVTLSSRGVRTGKRVR